MLPHFNPSWDWPLSLKTDSGVCFFLSREFSVPQKSVGWFLVLMSSCIINWVALLGGWAAFTLVLVGPTLLDWVWCFKWCNIFYSLSLHWGLKTSGIQSYSLRYCCLRKLKLSCFCFRIFCMESDQTNVEYSICSEEMCQRNQVLIYFVGGIRDLRFSLHEGY